MDKYERLLRRLLVLTSWGYSGEFHDLETCERWLSTDEKLAEWYGEGWADQSVLDDLAAIDLIAQSQVRT